MILGRSLDDLKIAARKKAIAHFTAEQESARPAALAVTDALKLAEAKIVIALGTSAYITAEAKLKGVTPLELAKKIKAEAEASALTIELKRQAVNVDIDKAASHTNIKAILEKHGIDWPT